MADIDVKYDEKSIGVDAYDLTSVNLEESIKGLRENSVLLQMWCNTVIQQANLKNEILGDLPMYQEQCRQSCNQYFDDMLPLLIGVYADIGDITNTYFAYNMRLQKLGSHLDIEEDRKRCVVALNELKQVIREKKENSSQFIINLKKYIDKLNAIMDNYNVAFDEASSKLNEKDPDSDINQLKKTIQGKQDEYNSDIALSIGSAATMLLGSVMIGVGVIGEVFSDGVSTSLIIGGGTMIAGGTVSAATAAYNAEQTMKELINLQSELYQDEAIYGTIVSIHKFSNNICDYLVKFRDFNDAIQSTYGKILLNINNIMINIQNKELSSDEFLTILSDGLQNWIDLKSYASRYKVTNQVPIEKTIPVPSNSKLQKNKTKLNINCINTPNYLQMHLNRYNENKQGEKLKLNAILGLKTDEKENKSDEKTDEDDSGDGDAAAKDMSSHVQDQTSNMMCIQTYCNTIIEQPDLDFTGLKNDKDFKTLMGEVVSNQVQARKHAHKWMDEELPQCIQSQADIKGFCNAYISYYGLLYKFAGKENKDDFVSVINELKDIVHENQDNCQTIIKSLQDFDDEVGDDARAFSEILSKAQTEMYGIQGDDEHKGAIAAMDNQIQALDKAMNADLDMIAGGVTAGVVGAVVIAIGALAEIPTFGVSTSLMVGGFVTAATGAGVSIYAGDDYAKNSAKKSQLIREEDQVKKQIAALQSIDGTFNVFKSSASKAVVALQSLLTGWTYVDKEFDELIDSLKRVDVDTFLRAQLMTTFFNFMDLKRAVEKMESFGTLPVSKNADTFINTQFESVTRLAAAPNQIHKLNKMNKTFKTRTSIIKILSSNLMLSVVELARNDETLNDANALLNEWNNNILPLCNDAIKNVDALYSEFVNSYNLIEPLVKDLNNEENKKNASNILNYIKAETVKNKNNYATLTNEIDSYQSKLNDNIRALNDEESKENSQLEAVERDLRSATAERDSIQKKYDVEKQIYDDTKCIPLFGPVEKLIGKLVNQLSGWDSTIQSDRNKIDADRNEINQIRQVLNAINAVNTSVKQSLNESQQIYLEFNVIVNEFDVIINAINAVNFDDIFVQAQLNILLIDWHDLKTVTSRYTGKSEEKEDLIGGSSSRILPMDARNIGLSSHSQIGEIALIGRESIVYVSDGAVIGTVKSSTATFFVEKMFNGNQNDCWRPMVSEDCSVTIVFAKGTLNVTVVSIKVHEYTTYDAQIFDGKWKKFAADEKGPQQRIHPVGVPCSQIRVNLKPDKGQLPEVFEIAVYVSDD